MATTVVKIKDWDHMAYEFGLDSDGDINCPLISFTSNMEYILPENRIITVTNGAWQHRHYKYTITEYMVETELDDSLSLVKYKKLI